MVRQRYRGRLAIERQGNAKHAKFNETRDENFELFRVFRVLSSHRYPQDLLAPEKLK
jgi:hypothetical protein